MTNVTRVPGLTVIRCGLTALFEIVIIAVDVIVVVVDEVVDVGGTVVGGTVVVGTVVVATVVVATVVATVVVPGVGLVGVPPPPQAAAQRDRQADEHRAVLHDWVLPHSNDDPTVQVGVVFLHVIVKPAHPRYR